MLGAKRGHGLWEIPRIGCVGETQWREQGTGGEIGPGEASRARQVAAPAHASFRCTKAARSCNSERAAFSASMRMSERMARRTAGKMRA